MVLWLLDVAITHLDTRDFQAVAAARVAILGAQIIVAGCTTRPSATA
jgi:hypothetical protein